MAQALQAQQNQQGASDGFHELGKFQRNNPPTFKGIYDPEGAQVQLQDIEKIFGVMAWWDNAHQRLEDAGNEITWENFKKEFLEKYFPTNVQSKKEIEFLELKQGNMIVADYMEKFEELVRLCSHYNGVEAEGSKCIKFESDSRPKIKQFIGYQEIHRFLVLVNKCRIYEEDIRVIFVHYSSASEKKSAS